MRCLFAQRGIFFLIFFTIVSYALSSRASTYISVGDDVNRILDRLEAEGILRSGLLSTKPISRKEAVRLLKEAESNVEGRSSFIRSLVRSLRERLDQGGTGETVIQPVDVVYGKYIHTNADVLTLVYEGAQEKEQAFNYNNDGDLYAAGENFRTGFTSRIDDLGPFSLYLNPEFRSSKDDHDLVLRTAYGVLHFGWDLVLGRDAQWWGPGYNGAILLSNNAEPFTMVRLTNPVSEPLPWIFKYLGPLKFTFFVTRLDKDRNDFAEPQLWGMRFDFKPHPLLEVGLERTALMGGQGRPEGPGTWIDGFFGRNEHGSNETGDQRAGYDLKLTLPFRLQPLQVYWQAAGEDNVHGYPTQWAYLAGIYLPRVLACERIGLRAEYASTHMTHHPGSAWYTHHIYTSGYTYNDMIIGHHMGSDSRDAFFELSYRMPERNARIALSYDEKQHNVSEPVRETTSETALHAEISLARRVNLMASCGYGRIKNPGNLAGPTRGVSAFTGGVQYQF